MPNWSMQVAGCAVAVAVLAACGLTESEVAPPDGSPPVREDAGHSQAPQTDAGRKSVDASVVSSGGGDASLVPDAIQPTTGALDASVTACPTAEPPAPTCGASLCGNGTIDTCSVCGECGPGGGGPPGFDAGSCCSSEAETCDGADLGGATCESLGFTGGTLGCNAGCGWDVSACDTCGSDSRIVACGNPALHAAGAVTMALATSATAIGLAWITSAGAESAAGGLHVATLGSDLSVVEQTACLPAIPSRRVAMAATPAGWIVAAEITDGVALYPLAADASPSGAATTLAGASVPILAAQPAGGPLLVWTSKNGDDAYATFLGVDGSVGATVPLFTQVVEPQYGSAVFIGDGFLVGLRASLGATVVHVGLDGTLGAAHSLGDETEYPQLAWTGSEARVVYGDFSTTGAMMLARLDATGAPLSSPVMAGNIPAYYDPAPIVTAGGDTVALLPGYTGGTDIASHLDLTRIAASGQAVYAPYVVAEKNAVASFSPYALGVLGTDVVAAWLTSSTESAFPGALGVARLSP